MADDPQNTPGNGPEDKPEGAPGTSTGSERQGEAGKGAEGDQADAVKTAETARAAAEKRASEAEQEAARLRRSNAATKGTDLDALRSEVRAEFTEALVRAELRAAAAGKLRDPADALALLDVASLAGSGGDIDAAAVAAAVDQLVKDKPYLAVADQGSPAPMWGDVGAGQRDTAEPEPATPFDRLRRAYDA
ncbi:hypothetical protein [Streptomyces sp. OspMP-M43]|uniref:hypothetical protein n=1 Tax=Streptomyces sp. OspMP-M43 TaxID=1839781 RepID=UPI00081B95E3|nr:hypothetical protein [Streptomyces sp. OspMP-M43]SCD35582.1 hypothetical protein GA0115261_1000819 [Streptomyces sp. OspMP-M43]